MENRGVYRGVEDVALSGNFDRDLYPHSYISRNFRYSIREQSDLRQILLAKLMAVSALGSHPKMDIDSGLSLKTELLTEAMNTIPYFSPKKNRNERERERAVELFNEVADEMERLVGKLVEKDSGKVDIEHE